MDDMRAEEAQRETERIIGTAERAATRLVLVGAHFGLSHMHRHKRPEPGEQPTQVIEPEMLEETGERLKAIAIQKTGHEDILKDVPHYDIGDVAIIPRYQIDDTVGYIPTRDSAADYRMTPQEILEAAVHNVRAADYRVDKLGNVLGALGVPDVPDSPVYVCHNGTDYLGAAGAFVSRDVRKKIRDKIGGDYYVLPSSIHEVLIVPATSDLSPWELEHMVQTVNREVVAPEDRLSDTVFKVDKSLKIVPAISQKQTKNPLEELRRELKM